MPILVKRLHPDADIYAELKALASEHSIDAAVVLSLVGSLKEGSLRLAGQDKATKFAGPFEIVSATGTVCRAGLHVHVSLADLQGHVVGGHLQPGNLVHTTCEIVLHDFSKEWKFERVLDVTTGYPELVGVALHLK
jgi:uncharacterized protein